jgi:penicillin-binding protein 2
VKTPDRYTWQFWLLRLLIVAAVLVLSVRLYKLQIVEGSKYRVLADRNRLRDVEVAGPRGVIYDRNGEILARNEPSFSVAVIPADMPKTPAGEADVEAQAVVLDRLMDLLSRPVPFPSPSPMPSPSPTVTPTVSAARTPTPGPTPIKVRDVIPEREPWVMERAKIEEGIMMGLLGGAYRPIIVAKYIDQYTAFLIAEQASNLPGVELELQPIRDYLSGTLTSQLIGYMGGIPADDLPAYEAKSYQQNDQVGLTGLENTMEDELRGQVGRQTIEVDVNGRKVRTVGQSEPPLPGHNLVLSLDLKLQRAATEAVQEALDQSKGFTKATQGVAVVLDPRSGAVLALVSLPSFDNNWFAKGITTEAWDALNNNPDRPLINKAVSGQYPPGSTYKLVPASGGLQEGVITVRSLLGDGFDGVNEGIISLPSKYGGAAQPFYCWIHSYGRGHGLITVRQAIAESCDVFFYQLGGGYRDITPGLGAVTLGYYAKQFGFGEPTGIELTGEVSGLVPTEKYKRLNYAEPWYTGDTYNMSIGQGFDLATPLQIANMTAAVANRGTLYHPQLVDHITDAEGKLVKPFEPSIIRQVPVDPSYLDIVREGMYGAVNWPEGTAPGARLPGIAVAGKTGTAEYFRDDDKDGQPDRDQKGNLPTHAWFTSFAPYADPEIVVTVMIVNGGEGSQVSVPIANKIMRAYFNIEDTPPPGAAAPTPTPGPQE